MVILEKHESYKSPTLIFDIKPAQISRNYIKTRHWTYLSNSDP